LTYIVKACDATTTTRWAARQFGHAVEGVVRMQRPFLNWQERELKSRE
jgi:hypothetical protein